MSTFNDNQHDEVCKELEALETKYAAARQATIQLLKVLRDPRRFTFGTEAAEVHIAFDIKEEELQ